MRAFTVVLLLSWQGLVMAHACAHAAVYADGCATSQPCKAPGAKDEATGHALHQAHWVAQHVSTGTAKPGVIAAADLPALAVRLDGLAAIASAIPVAALPAPRAESPRLIILQRRLRN